MRRIRLVPTLALTLVLFAGGAHVFTQTAARVSAALADDVVLTAPERVGFSGEALKELDPAMQGIVDKKQLAGVVTLLARHGQVVQHKAYGVQDLESQTPMQLDTIMRIYSMTKPIAGAAMMMLYEEGKWQPSDPIAKHIPEFANLKVFAGMDAERPADPRRADPCADDGRADVAQRGLHVRPVRQLAGRQDVPGGQPARRAVAAGVHRQGGEAAAALPARREVGLQRLGRHSGIPGPEALGEDVPRFPARSHLHAARDEGHRVPRAGSEALARGDDLRVGPEERRARGAAARPADQQDAGAAVGRRRLVLHRRGLLPLRADDRQRRRARRQAPAEAGVGRR